LLNTDEIKCAKHIVITLPKSTSISLVASANALYTYLLTLHKKVSFFSNENTFARNLDFLPWMDKLKNSYPSSADLEIKVQTDEEIMCFFEEQEVALNAKMATSLYASILAQSDGFSKGINSMLFARAKSYVEAGADLQVCTKNILNFIPLSTLRLKTLLLEKMCLKENAQVAFFELSEEDLKKSGAKIDDAKSVVKDALSLPSVKRVVVKYENKEIIRQGE